MSLGGRDGAERIYGSLVSSNYFNVLGTRAAVGRFFSPDDGEEPGAAPLVVLSYAFWQRRFAGDPSVAGRAITIERPTIYCGRRGGRRIPRHDRAVDGSVGTAHHD
jgi:hypothetical protein